MDKTKCAACHMNREMLKRPGVPRYVSPPAHTLTGDCKVFKDVWPDHPFTPSPFNKATCYYLVLQDETCKQVRGHKSHIRGAR